ncbi:MAG: hypothetical protein JO360_06300 [Acidobacteria bacterium]|nr:hypothetical protein [Acidobacteriota bacterium]
MTHRQYKLIAALLALAALTAAACSGGAAQSGNQSTPTLAYKALYEAVKKKDPEAINKVLSTGTQEMMKTYAGMQKKTYNEVIENGLTETTFAPKLPESRNEKITGNVAILEVKNEKTGAWDALPFAKEDGQWKLAIDTYFRGTMSPSGPTNPEHPGELPPGAQPGVPSATPPNGKPSLKQGPQPGTPLAPGSVPPAEQTPPPAPTQSGKPSAQPEKSKGIKPPTR